MGIEEKSLIDDVRQHTNNGRETNMELQKLGYKVCLVLVSVLK